MLATAPTFSTIAPAQSSASPAVVERRAEKEGDHRLRRARHRQGAPDFVPPAERIAVFDNDGTLWAEQPMYFQFAFALDRVKALAPQHPEWKDEAAVQGACSRAT